MGFAEDVELVVEALGPSVAGYNRVLGALVVNTYSVVDGESYRLVVYPTDGYPDEPPAVYVAPYPVYVQRKKRFKESHVRSCCLKKRVGGVNVCFFHVQSGRWRELRGDGGLAVLLMHVLQALDLRVPRLSYSLYTRPR